MDLIERKQGESKAFRLKNVVDVRATLALLCALPWNRASSGVGGRRTMISSRAVSRGRTRSSRWRGWRRFASGSATRRSCCATARSTSSTWGT